MTPDQIILVGLLASVITFALRVLATYLNYRPGRVVVNIGLYLVSAGLAYIWSGFVFPPFPPFDPNIAAFALAVWQYLNDLVALAAPILGAASLIYNLLYEKVVVPVFLRLARK